MGRMCEITHCLGYLQKQMNNFPVLKSGFASLVLMKESDLPDDLGNEHYPMGKAKKAP